MKNRITRYTVGLSLPAVFLLAAYACCTDKYCTGADDLNQISFYNFSQQDLDTMVIMQFEKSTDFSNRIDSSFIINDYMLDTPGYIGIFLDHKLSVEYDYKLIIVSTGQIYTISGFEVIKEKCNTGFLCTDYYNSLERYKVNDKIQQESILKIFNPG